MNRHLESQLTKYHEFLGVGYDCQYSPADEMSIRLLYEPQNRDSKTANLDPQKVPCTPNQLNRDSQT